MFKIEIKKKPDQPLTQCWIGSDRDEAFQVFFSKLTQDAQCWEVVLWMAVNGGWKFARHYKVYRI